MSEKGVFPLNINLKTYSPVVDFLFPVSFCKNSDFSISENMLWAIVNPLFPALNAALLASKTEFLAANIPSLSVLSAADAYFLPLWA